MTNLFDDDLEPNVPPELASTPPHEAKPRGLKERIELALQAASVTDACLDDLYHPDCLAYLAQAKEFAPLEFQRFRNQAKLIKGFLIRDFERELKNYRPDTVETAPPEPDNPPPFDAEWESKLLALVERFNQHHANVIINGKNRIMRTTQAGVNYTNRAGHEYIHPKDFEPLYTNTSIQTGVRKRGEVVCPVYNNHFRAWLEHPNCRVYRGGVVFRPQPLGAEPLPKRYFNLWQGYTVAPAQGKWSLLHDHLLQVVCNGSQTAYDYVINWIAHKLQNPQIQSGIALVIKGAKGTGKGTLGHFLMSLYGQHGLHISNSQHLVGHFNGHLQGVCFLFADEAFFAGDKRHESTQKALITEPVLTIERKGLDPEQQPNYLQILMATNEQWAVPVSTDERRYCVLEVSDQRKGDKSYFDKLHAHISRDATKAAFLYDMLARDVGQWDKSQIPETAALRAQRAESLDSVGRWLVDWLGDNYSASSDTITECGTEVAGYCYFTESYRAGELQAYYLAWCDQYRISEHNRATTRRLGEVLGAVFTRGRNNQGKHYTLGKSLNAARLALCKYYKIDMELVEPDIRDKTTEHVHAQSLHDTRKALDREKARARPHVAA